MSCYRFEQLDVSDAAARGAYELTFYEAFVRVRTNRLIHTLWSWDHEARRLATRISYDDQVVFVLIAEDGRVETGLACNIGMREFQSSAFGFRPPADTSACFEILTFFSLTDHHLERKLHFWQECLRRLGALGYLKGYATTALRPLRVYRRIGWRLLEQCEREGEQRYFLEYELTAPACTLAFR